MRAFSRLLLIPATWLLLAAINSACAGPLTVSGTAGYLSEWQLSGRVTESPSGDAFAGALIVKHVGLCSHDGPEEKATELKLQMIGLRPWSQFRASLVLDGATCTFSGRFSGHYSGFMDCAGAKGVPVTLSLQ